MSAYYIANISAVTDPEKMKEYAAGAGPIIEKFGGKGLAASPPELFEGESDTMRAVVIEFADMAALKNWYNSDEYKPLAELRISVTEGLAYALEGM